MHYDWIISSFTGDRAKSVKVHAEAGIGYFIQQEAGAGQNHTVVAAFRKAGDEPLEAHQNYASIAQCMKLETMDRQRRGLQTRQ